MKIDLDAGHGGKDPGAVANGLQEKDIVLPISLKAGETLKRHNVKVDFSRTTDKFVGLTDRAIMANNHNADVFVSIHCNKATNTTGQGVETYYYAGSIEGKKLATCIQDSIMKSGLYTKNRGIKEGNFAVLRHTNMPSALVELGFISNVEDAKILKEKQEELAEAVARGILNYLGIEMQEKGMNNTMDKINIKLHGKDLEIDGIFKDNTNYIPVKFLRELGYKIGWENGKVIIEYK